MSNRIERILSRFASLKSEKARLESLVDPSKLSGLDEDDPKSMGQFMKSMGQEMGEDFGDDLSDAIESDTSGSVESGDIDSQ